MQPQQPTQPPTPMPEIAPQPFNAPLTPQPQSRKKWLIIGGLVVLLAIIAGLIFWFMQNQKPSATTSQNSAPANLHLPSGSEITAANLSSYNKDDLFWGYFQYASQQQKVVTQHLFSQIVDIGKPGLVERMKVGFDYKTKKLVAAVDTLDVETNTKVTDNARCYDGKRYARRINENNPGQGGASKWQETEPDRCDLYGMSSFLMDGVNAGGLSAEQSAAFARALRDQKGLFSVKSVAFESHKDKQYLHFTADLTPIPFGGSSYEGLPLLDAAFSETNLDPVTHPYSVKLAFGGGLHIEYWVDPQKQLPVYAEVSDTPTYNENGQPNPLEGNVTMTTIFDFSTSEFDANTTNEAPVNPTW